MGSTQKRWRSAVRGATLVLAALAGSAATARAGGSGNAQPLSDARRLYIYFDTGHAFKLHDRFVGDVDVEATNGYNTVLGGGFGYNLSDHWGIELQVQYREPNLRSAERGKLAELATLTLIPAVRYRHPLMDGRLVPYATAGFGASLSDVNDFPDSRIEMTMDERAIVGSVGAGVEYFVAPNVAAGLTAQYLIHPRADTHIRVPEGQGLETFSDDSSVDLSAVALLAHLRLFFGQAAGGKDKGTHGRRLLLADRGPFDTAAMRAYLYGLVGRAFVSDDDIGAGVDLEGPVGFETDLGGGLGLNLTRHWGIEVQVPITEGELRADSGEKLGEWTTTTVLPSLRYRHPLSGGRVVPFVTASVGAAFNDLNDGKRDRFEVDLQDVSVAGAVGLGVEYFLNSNISVGLSVPYYIYPDWDTRVDRLLAREGRTVVSSDRGDANISGFVPQFQMKVYLP